MDTPSTYRPGTCNIGGAARRQRLLVALVAFLGAGGYAAFVTVSGAPTVLLPGLFVPFALGIEYGLQARRSFCATLALQGRYDFRGEGGGTGSVGDPAARRDDRQYALRLAVLGLLGGAVLTGVAYGVVVLSGV
jgi:hypothetical protein